MISTLKQRVHVTVQDHLVLVVSLTEELQKSVGMANYLGHTLISLPVRHLQEIKHHSVSTHVTKKTLFWAAVLSSHDKLSQ